MPATAPRFVPLANGLVYVDSSMPGLRRSKRGAAFRYRDARGAWIRDAEEIARIRRLAIPPAYKDVWICPVPNGHLQATGIDARGRKQYRYHAQWRALKDETKFDRLEAFGRALPGIRRRVSRDLRTKPGEPLRRELVLATIVRLLDTTFLRIGNEEYMNSNGSYGLTTLRTRHADTHGGTLRLRFRGKSGVLHEAEMDDPRVAKVVRRCQQLPGQELFQYEGEDGTPTGISSTDVNDYLREIAGEEFSAKDFRTWHGTVQALDLIRLRCACEAAAGPAPVRAGLKEVLSAVASRLGNTPAVCKKAYVHPAVLGLIEMLNSNSEESKALWDRVSHKVRNQRDLRASEQRLLAFLLLARERASKSKKPSLMRAGLFGAVRA
ncbi:DNA topoisomerase IB [Variovorax ureilyticus]|uniref:DNA topoisomerase n=1 Tax=Variovorax ureilyticus TaxID=1836198 RepID=A0ABU8VQX8_9BURK